MTAMQALRDAGIDRQVACEVSLPFWRGRVDFYHIPSKIVVQADGRSHRVVTHKLQPGRQLKLDLRCCIKAWKGDMRLLRLYHSPGGDHSSWSQIILAATRLRCAKFVMLSNEYNSLCVDTAQQQTVIQWLTAKLEGAQFRFDQETQCYLWLTL
jgi:hypothetical protein